MVECLTRSQGFEPHPKAQHCVLEQDTLSSALSTGSTEEEGAQWLSGRVLDSRLRCLEFQPHPEALRCVLEQDTLSSALITGSTQEDLSIHI